ncbi:MAG: DUF2393 family protein [Acidobacteria bacterium]|nr:DUF2393 family protein [Acidobacteriota bacterium]
MGGHIEPSPLADEPTLWRPILMGVVIVVVVVGAVVLGLRHSPPPASGPASYAPRLKISDLKMSAAENFVGATVSYVDGTITNTGTKTVTHAVVHTLFKDEMGQVVGDESLPVHVLETGGPYPDVLDLNASPLRPGQTKPFRLTFESISAQWNHQFPQLEITDVVTK